MRRMSQGKMILLLFWRVQMNINSFKQIREKDNFSDANVLEVYFGRMQIPEQK